LQLSLGVNGYEAIYFETRSRNILVQFNNVSKVGYTAIRVDGADHVVDSNIVTE